MRSRILCSMILMMCILFGMLAACRSSGTTTTQSLETTLAPTPKPTIPAILSSLPDSVLYNEERNEYYDTVFLTWDSEAQTYDLVIDSTVFPSFRGMPIEAEIWQYCFSDPDNELDVLLEGLHRKVDAFIQADEELSMRIKFSSSTDYPWEVLYGPLEPLSGLRLSQLPRLFRYIDTYSVDSATGLDLATMFRDVLARIDSHVFTIDTPDANQDMEGETWSADHMEYYAKWGPNYGYTAYLAVFRDRVQQAPDALSLLLKSDWTDAEKGWIMRMFGIAALPFYFDRILLHGEDDFLPYVHAALPFWLIRREAAIGNTVDSSTDLETIRGYLAECWDDAQGVKAVGQMTFQPEQDDPTNRPVDEIQGYTGNTSTLSSIDKPWDHDWGLYVWMKTHPDAPDEGRYCALIEYMQQADIPLEEILSGTPTIAFSLESSGFSVHYLYDSEAQKIYRVNPETGAATSVDDVAVCLRGEPDRFGNGALRLIVRFDGPPISDILVSYKIEDGYSGHIDPYETGYHVRPEGAIDNR